MSRNATVALLERLRRRSVRVDVRGESLHVSAPPGAVTTGDRDELRSFKAELLERLRLEAQVVDLSLDDFARQSHSLELAVPWLVETIWWVPRAEHIDDLVRDGVHRGRIWTAAELRDLLAVPGLTEQDLVSLGRLKLDFDADIVSVQVDRREEPHGKPEERRRCRACHETRYWISIHGVTVCGTCHPPAAPDLVTEWIESPDSGSRSEESHG